MARIGPQGLDGLGQGRGGGHGPSMARVRDHRTLALVFVAPIVIMALLGWVIRDQKPPTSTIAASASRAVEKRAARLELAEPVDQFS